MAFSLFNQQPVAPQPATGGFAPVAPQQVQPVNPAPSHAGAPQAQQAPVAPAVSAAEIAALRAAQMGKSKRGRLPQGDYIIDGECTEFFNANEGKKGAPPNRALSLLFTVVESSNPSIAPGSRGKVSEFFDTSYIVDAQLAKFKSFCGNLYGAQDEAQLDAINMQTMGISDWLTPLMQPVCEIFAGARYQLTVRNKTDRAGRPALDTHGNPKTIERLQRIG